MFKQYQIKSREDVIELDVVRYALEKGEVDVDLTTREFNAFLKPYESEKFINEE